jgi:uncharacterized protein YidB (DUF937 family)
MGALNTVDAGAVGVAEKVSVERPKLLPELTKLVQNMPDGVTGLLSLFEAKGLGAVVSSLTGKGPTLTILPEQILQVFGSEKINALATSTGLDPKVVPEQVATILPGVVKQLAPTLKTAGVA